VKVEFQLLVAGYVKDAEGNPSFSVKLFDMDDEAGDPLKIFDIADYGGVFQRASNQWNLIK